MTVVARFGPFIRLSFAQQSAIIGALSHRAIRAVCLSLPCELFWIGWNSANEILIAEGVSWRAAG